MTATVTRLPARQDPAAPEQDTPEREAPYFALRSAGLTDADLGFLTSLGLPPAARGLAGVTARSCDLIMEASRPS